MAFKINKFPDIKREILFEKKENQEEEPTLMRNRGSSVDTSSDEGTPTEKSKGDKDMVAKYYDSKTKPLSVKLEILIRILQLCCLDNIDINHLKDNP